MEQKVSEIFEAFQGDISHAQSSKSLDDLKIKYLGKKGLLQGLMQELRNCPQDKRPYLGKLINDLKETITQRLSEISEDMVHKEIESRLESERVDVTLPGRKGLLGRKHPITQMIEEVLTVLKEMGFSTVSSPEIESEYYNYGGLNYPPDHPARDMQDTYYLSDELLLRSHTTNFQLRVMQNHKLPIRAACAGKCYRNETITPRSHVLFHQVDVLYVDSDVTFADLLGTLELFYKKLFQKEIEIRVRPSYFPFVEPGIEVDIRCTRCDGKGCRLCKKTGWLEVCGAGMVHPEVLKEGGIDPDVYSGFAWGGGIERLFMLRHGISDIRLFTENDMRFLAQF